MLPVLIKGFLYPHEAAKICRICLRAAENVQSFDLCLEFGYVADALSHIYTVQDLLDEVTGEKVTSYEIFGGICDECLTCSIRSFLFKRRCLHSKLAIAECLNHLETLVKSSKIASPTTTILAQISQTNRGAADDMCVRNYQMHVNSSNDVIFQNEILPVILQKKTPKCVNVTPSLNRFSDDNCTSPKEVYCKIPVQKKAERRYEKGTGLQCDHCGKTFKCRSALQNHLVYHGKPIYSCNCQKSFKSKSDLCRHIRTVHLKKRLGPFICNYCGRPLATKYSLQIHLQIHEPKGWFRCDICDKIFDREILLRKHKGTHSNIRPKQCEICGCRFVNKKALLYHTRLHTGHRPYKCEMCEKKFISENRKKAHFQVCHTEKTVRCEFCDTMFHTKGRMRMHIKKVHFSGGLNY